MIMGLRKMYVYPFVVENVKIICRADLSPI